MVVPLLAHPLVPGVNAAALPLIAVIAATVESEYPTILVLSSYCYNIEGVVDYD